MMIGSKLRDRSVIIVTALFALAAILIGCGGSGGGGGTGSGSGTGVTATAGASGGSGGGNSLVFSLAWPASTRSLPGYANCVLLSIQRNGDSPITQIINRVNKIAYTQPVTFDSIPPGTYTVIGEAFL